MVAAELESIKKEAERKLRDVTTLEELDGVRVTLLGDEGSLTIFLRSLENLPEGRRGTAQRAAEELKEFLEGAIRSREEKIREDGTHE